MPTIKPRIAVTLNPPVYETITRLAALQGRSKGSVVAELLEAVHPPLMRTVALLEAALEAPKAVHAGLLQTIQGLERDLNPQMVDALGQMDWLLGEIQRASATGSGETTAGGEAPNPAASEGVNPRVLTGGSGGGAKEVGRSARATKKTKRGTCGSGVERGSSGAPRRRR